MAIAAVATITSCSQNEEFENLGQKAEIKMGTTAVTRATVMTTSKFLNFKAFGYYFTEGSYTAEVKGTKILDGIFNSVDQTTWTEKSGEKFYWPSDGKVTFLAIVHQNCLNLIVTVIQKLVDILLFRIQ